MESFELTEHGRLVCYVVCMIKECNFSSLVFADVCLLLFAGASL